MRDLLLILAVIILVTWDVTQNHNRLLNGLASLLHQLLRLVGIG